MTKTKYSKPIDLTKFRRTVEWRLDIASKQKAIAGKLISQTLQVKQCPICGGKESKHFVDVYEYPFDECTSCGHLFSRRPPTFEAVATLYTEDNHGKVMSAQAQIYIQKDLFDRRVKDIALPKAQFASDLIGKKGKWIDVGAGVGDLVIAAKGLGWDAIGYESDRQEVEFANLMGSNVVNKFLTPENMNVLGEATIVSTINVLEHILDPKSLVRSISANLSPGAFFLFEVPRFPSISSLANRCFPHLAARNIYSPDHLHLFTDKSAHLMLAEANLDLVSTWYFGQDIYEMVGNCLAAGSFSDHDLIDKTLSITNELQAVVDRSGLSDTMLVLARKNG